MSGSSLNNTSKTRVYIDLSMESDTHTHSTRRPAAVNQLGTDTRLRRIGESPLAMLNNNNNNNEDNNTRMAQQPNNNNIHREPVNNNNNNNEDNGQKGDPSINDGHEYKDDHKHHGYMNGAVGCRPYAPMGYNTLPPMGFNGLPPMGFNGAVGCRPYAPMGYNTLPPMGLNGLAPMGFNGLPPDGLQVMNNNGYKPVRGQALRNNNGQVSNVAMDNKFEIHNNEIKIMIEPFASQQSHFIVRVNVNGCMNNLNEIKRRINNGLINDPVNVFNIRIQNSYFGYYKKNTSIWNTFLNHTIDGQFLQENMLVVRGYNFYIRHNWKPIDDFKYY